MVEGLQSKRGVSQAGRDAGAPRGAAPTGSILPCCNPAQALPYFGLSRRLLYIPEGGALVGCQPPVRGRSFQLRLGSSPWEPKAPDDPENLQLTLTRRFSHVQADPLRDPVLCRHPLRRFHRARAREGAPKSRLHCVDRADSANADTAKMAFLQSLAQGLGNKQPGKSPRKPFESKVARTECTSDGPMTTCCGACGCCAWTGDGNGPRCVSNC